MDLEDLKKWVLREFKINLSAYKSNQLHRRILSLMSRVGVNTVDEYIALLKKDESQRQKFLDFITINVTEFFRNPEIFSELKNKIESQLLPKEKNLKIGLLLLLGFMLFLPNNVKAATTFEEEFPTGTATIRSVAPKNDSEAGAIFELLSNAHSGWSVNIETCNEGYTECTVTYAEENGELTITYSYDSAVKTVVDNLTKDISEELFFSMSDIELINYLVYRGENSSLPEFSEQLKSFAKYNNLKFFIDVRGGDGFPFYTANIGMLKFQYEDVLYYVKPGNNTVVAKHIFYVGSDVTDIENAVKTRIESVFKNVTATVVNTQEKVSAYIDDSEGFDEGGPYHFLLEYENEDVYEISINGGDPFKFIVLKDSSKVNNTLSFKSKDVINDVYISTDSVIPFDTLVKVARLTSGEDYERIINILKLASAEMFDLRLFSSSTNTNITQLEDGSFEVRIPIPSALNNKKLAVYYVGEDDEVEKINVTTKDGYAIFNTNHFSIYTLAEADDEPNPQTWDGILTSISIGSVSLMAIVGCGVYLNKKKRVN
jgi:hypothetical protein